MTAPLITTQVLTTEARITEDELRRRLAFEVMGQIGALDENGKPRAGVSYNVLRGDGRNPGYVVRVTRDMAKDTTPRLPVHPATGGA